MQDNKAGEPRHYRQLMKPLGLVNFTVALGESDLNISARRDLRQQAYEGLLACRQTLEQHIAANPSFLTSLQPITVPKAAPDLIQRMARAADAADVGPMAAVAGAVAEDVGRHLLAHSDEVIVENGGDIFLRTLRPRKMAIYAGQSPFSMRVALDLPPYPQGVGVCTSAATVGHSLSFGRADAVVILSPDAALADAWATSIGNMVKGKEDIEPALQRAIEADGLLGVVIIVGDALGARGELNLTAP